MTAIMTDAEFIEFRRTARQSQCEGEPGHHESPGRNSEVFVMEKVLRLPAETFAFQCSCGAKHQFEYIENEEGTRLLRVR